MKERAGRRRRDPTNDAQRPDQVEGTNAWAPELYRRLIAFRRRTPWLTDARIVTSDVSNTYVQITATPRDHRGGRTHR